MGSSTTSGKPAHKLCYRHDEQKRKKEIDPITTAIVVALWEDTENMEMTGK